MERTDVSIIFEPTLTIKTADEAFIDGNIHFHSFANRRLQRFGKLGSLVVTERACGLHLGGDFAFFVRDQIPQNSHQMRQHEEASLGRHQLQGRGDSIAQAHFVGEGGDGARLIIATVDRRMDQRSEVFAVVQRAFQRVDIAFQRVERIAVLGQLKNG